MDSENHIPLSDLIKSLSEGVNALNSGDASKEEVHQMLSLSRELHERLTVLRFKAFEGSANSEDSKSKDDVISEAQIDLIDSILFRPSLTNIGSIKSLAEILFSDTKSLIHLDFLNLLSLVFGKDPIIFM